MPRGSGQDELPLSLGDWHVEEKAKKSHYCVQKPVAAMLLGKFKNKHFLIHWGFTGTHSS